jgi:hypothetical protein
MKTSNRRNRIQITFGEKYNVEGLTYPVSISYVTFEETNCEQIRIVMYSSNGQILDIIQRSVKEAIKHADKQLNLLVKL